MLETTIAHIQNFINRPDFLAAMSIVPVTAFVTWLHVWMALKMVFYPIKFWGFRIGSIPIGWQGIVPRKAGRISGIITDNTLSKIGSLKEFIDAMDPQAMADFVEQQVKDDLDNLIDEVMSERQNSTWQHLPYAVKRRIYAYAHQELPHIINELMTDLTSQVEDLVNMREMVVHTMENDRRLMVKMFMEVGKKEINFIWHVSAIIGIYFGILQMILWFIIPHHWTVPILASIWGFLTNWIAIYMVFNPLEPKPVKYLKAFKLTKNRKFPWVYPLPPHISTYNIQGAFMKRQDEVSSVFARVVTEELITLKTIMTEMMYGAKKDQTRRVIKQHVYQIMDNPWVSGILVASLGFKEYGELKKSLVEHSIELTMKPMSDPEFNASRAQKIYTMFRDRIRELTPQEFQNLLRPAFQEDEWILIVLGGITGFLAGLAHLFIAFL
ncbi:hypothetical protein [Moraxella sp. ZY210820]|uniref:hypothetical protein n=1 Tax=unclassified Moraxella TaxID=2685852 RepID=UPI00272F6FD4|nr:hypothetical protein [Moraxella sp. ZY210820]WLF83153.1 hypothetical protein LU301_07705 [Moraxella sp. ZY210820]